jgi:hypothetical protein
VEDLEEEAVVAAPVTIFKHGGCKRGGVDVEVWTTDDVATLTKCTECHGEDDDGDECMGPKDSRPFTQCVACNWGWHTTCLPDDGTDKDAPAFCCSECWCDSEGLKGGGRGQGAETMTTCPVVGARRGWKWRPTYPTTGGWALKHSFFSFL